MDLGAAGQYQVTVWRNTLEDPEAFRDGDSATVADLLIMKPTDMWVVLLLRSGHFAGAVFQNGRAVVHKCFHR